MLGELFKLVSLVKLEHGVNFQSQVRRIRKAPSNLCCTLQGYIHKHQFYKVHDHHVYLDTDNVEQADKEKQRAWWSRSLPRMIWKPLLLYVAVYYVIFVVIE